MDALENIKLFIDQPAPLFKLTDLQGEEHALRDHLGKIVILNFWSAECPWAKKGDDSILSLVKMWGEDVVLLSIASNANEEEELLRSEMDIRKIPTLLHDKHQEVAKQYHAVTTPHIYVIDREGVLKYQGALSDVNFRQPEPTINYLSLAVESLLIGENPDPSEVPSYGCTVVYHNVD